MIAQGGFVGFLKNFYLIHDLKRSNSTETGDPDFILVPPGVLHLEFSVKCLQSC